MEMRHMRQSVAHKGQKPDEVSESQDDVYESKDWAHVSVNIEEGMGSGSGSGSGSGNKDRRIMAQMGKKPQLSRRFNFISMISFSSTMLVTWEALGSTFQAGLLNGGPVSLVYGFILALVGTLALSASLAELASITPIAGAQYHWTAQFAPRKYAVSISWTQGWITVFAWMALTASATFLAATEIQGLMVLNYANYTPARWHGTLLMWAIMVLTLIINIFFIKLLPHLESVAGVCHVLFFFILLVPLVYLAPQSPNSFVFTDFENSGGYSDGVSWCLGLLTVTFSFIGFDGVVHMSEEVENPSTSVPRSMILTVLINGILGLGWIIALLYSIGNINDVTATRTGYPIIQIFYQAVESAPAATAMMSCIVIIIICAVFAVLASTSRLTWAFARDNGLPFSEFFAYVSPTYNIPIRTIVLVSVVVGLLGLINIASTTAFNAITSLSTLALYVSYLIPVILLTSKKIQRQHIPYGPWKMGRFGLAVNIFAIVYGVFIVVFLPFPPALPVTATTMNYSSPVFGLVLLFAFGYWFVRGKRQYAGPLREVEPGVCQNQVALDHTELSLVA